MNSIQQIERDQLRAQINQSNAALALTSLEQTDGAALRRMRKALGMSGAALSQRLGAGRSRAANLEASEREHRLTLSTLQEAAQAMGCRLVYTVLPPPGQTVEDLVEAQAERVARQQLAEAAPHMALEEQSLDSAQTEAELQRLVKQLIQSPPRDFWHSE